jgi:glucosamine-6-phosphate deaminase
VTSRAKIHEKVVIVKNYEALSRLAASEIAEMLSEKPNCNLALPTGNSPVGCYELLAEWSKSGDISWKESRCFALDDYIDSAEEHSFKAFLQTKLYQFTDLPENSQFNPRFSDDYDDLIAKHGGLDCILLGIGRNGHIAFNEPPTPRSSWTHCVWLSDSTKEANRKYFEGASVIPTRAITMGISTILNSRRIILIASGKEKRSILERALTGTEDASIPASFITSHRNLLVIADFDC